MSYCTKYGQSLSQSAGQILRKNVELCDSFHGFQILHSCAGGVGSGLTSLLLEDMKWKFPGSSIVTASVFPAEAAGHIGNLIFPKTSKPNERSCGILLEKKLQIPLWPPFFF